jgi:hypothetical protein
VTTEWDNTAWNGTPVSSAVAVKRRRRPVAKAETGPFVANIISNPPLSALARSPQKKMREAQSLFHRHPWIGAAERAVTRKVVGLPWHLEDENDDEVADESSPEAKAIQALMERPQAALVGRKQMTRRELWSLTSRHVGLCGMAYWYLDQLDALGRTPTAILYVNPARVWPQSDRYGNLIGWKLDCTDDAGNGGMPLELDELLPFYLDPPDWGHYGTGFVEAAWQKAQITGLADSHASHVLASGGRIAGIVPQGRLHHRPRPVRPAGQGLPRGQRTPRRGEAHDDPPRPGGLRLDRGGPLGAEPDRPVEDEPRRHLRHLVRAPIAGWDRRPDGRAEQR